MKVKVKVKTKTKARAPGCAQGQRVHALESFISRSAWNASEATHGEW